MFPPDGGDHGTVGLQNSLLESGANVLGGKCPVDKAFGNALDEPPPGDAAAAHLGAGNRFFFEDQDIEAFFGQQCGAGKAAGAGPDYDD